MAKEEKSRRLVRRVVFQGGLVLGVSLIAAGLALIFPRFSSPEVEIISSEKEKEVIMVDIEGEVLRPGVYRLEGGARVNDLLVAAGGLAPEADREWVSQNLNRAALLVDGQKIYIPPKREFQKEGKVAGVGEEKININTAEAAQLERLPGVGPSLAKKIIEYRQEKGGFISLEELMAVPGIGPKSFEKLKEKITL